MSRNFMAAVVDRMTALQNVHALILGTCKYVTLLGKGTLWVWLRTLRWKNILHYPGGPNVIVGFLKIWEPFPLSGSQGGGLVTRSGLLTDTCCEDRGEAASQGRVTLKTGKGKPAGSPLEGSYHLHRDLSQEDPCCLSDLQNSNIINSYGLTNYQVNGNLLQHNKNY